jgi:hypothetical protein
MLMNRAELERLDREALVAHAEEAGVTRARILTRPELVDELLLRSAVDQATKQRARGLFGRARDLLARVVEQGLHLPDAAERIRAVGGVAPPSRPSAPAALPTVTLAEIYAAQGHRERALETLDRVITREPDHAAARALRAQLEDASFPVPTPNIPPEGEEEESRLDGTADDEDAPADDVAADDAPADDVAAAPPPLEAAAVSPAAPPEPAHMLDDAPLPPRYDVDECIAIPVDPTTLYVYWEIRQRTLDYLRATRPGGTVALRAVVIVPTWDGPRSSVRDHDVHAELGDYFVRDLPGGCVVRVAVGYRQGEAFVAVAHSPSLETPPGAPAPVVADVLVRWTLQGAVPVTRRDPDAPSIERAVRRIRRGAGSLMDPERHPEAQESAPQGSSERWAEIPVR